jgi:pyruvate-formate lyase-activating enzyme
MNLKCGIPFYRNLGSRRCLFGCSNCSNQEIWKVCNGQFSKAKSLSTFFAVSENANPAHAELSLMFSAETTHHDQICGIANPDYNQWPPRL